MARSVSEAGNNHGDRKKGGRLKGKGKGRPLEERCQSSGLREMCLNLFERDVTQAVFLSPLPL
jgi:hypothetical protein